MTFISEVRVEDGGYISSPAAASVDKPPTRWMLRTGWGNIDPTSPVQAAALRITGIKLICSPGVGRRESNVPGWFLKQLVSVAVFKSFWSAWLFWLSISRRYEMGSCGSF